MCIIHIGHCSCASVMYVGKRQRCYNCIGRCGCRTNDLTYIPHSVSAHIIPPIFNNISPQNVASDIDKETKAH